MKSKIINDPVHGFISVPSTLLFSIIEHPYFQRLRRIKQLGMSHLVYPGALHTRFQHSLGAMHLMSLALASLREKGHDISRHEWESALAAILLHDVGHGPFSHALEHSVVSGIRHEEISLHLINAMDAEFGGMLSTARKIFSNTYHKTFLHQLVSGQLDMDRLDYLQRDSFFCGVTEGTVSTDRIIKMLNISNGQIVVEAKGIYSLEKFIIARKLMYWQVYLHKTVISAEYILIRILKRARELALSGRNLHASPALTFFLENNVSGAEFEGNREAMLHFSRLDDFDIFSAVKVWAGHEDAVLSYLCNCLVNRVLFRIEMQKEPFSPEYIAKIRKETGRIMDLPEGLTDYFVVSDSTSSYTYDPVDETIRILLKNGRVIDFTEASEEFDLTVLTRPVTKYILGYPKNIQAVDN